MKRKKEGLLFIVMIGMMAALTGCGDDPKPSPSVNVVAASQGGAKAEAVGDGTEDALPDSSEDPSATPSEEPTPEATETPTPEATEEPKETEEPKSEGKGKSYSDILGTYKVVAMSMGDICLDVRNEPEVKSARLVLKKNGKGTLAFDKDKEKIKWKLKKNKLTIIDSEGDTTLGAMGAIIEIVYEKEMIVFKTDAEESGKGAAYFARKGTDISWLKMMSVEEYNKMMEENQQ